MKMKMHKQKSLTRRDKLSVQFEGEDGRMQLKLYDFFTLANSELNFRIHMPFCTFTFCRNPRQLRYH